MIMNNQKIWRVSWVAYLKTLIFLPLSTLILSAILMVVLSITLSLLTSFYFEPDTVLKLENYPASFDLTDNQFVLYIACIVWGFITFIFGILALLNLRSIKLYIDEEGVWAYSGIFPWSKGSFGIKWRDLDTALYMTGFLSWACKSYTITVSHRFTKDSEIVLKNVYKGDQFVKQVNTLHQYYLEENNIEVGSK